MPFDHPLRRLAVGLLPQLLPLRVVFELRAQAMRLVVQEDLIDPDLDPLAVQRLPARPRQPRHLMPLRRLLAQLADQTLNPLDPLGLGDLRQAAPFLVVASGYPPLR